MRTFDVDFNRLARGGAVKVRLKDGERPELNERVLLVEADEDMEREAVLAEVEDGFAYFKISESQQDALDAELERAKQADVSAHFTRNWVLDAPTYEPESIAGLFTLGYTEAAPSERGIKVRVKQQRTHGNFLVKRLTSGRS
jgi:hypothetical protein